MSKRWIKERERDRYHRLAKLEGYRSRAAYKLIQVQNKYRFMREGDIVIDLGAAPGGWMKAARIFVGERGYVLGIDLKHIENFEWPNVESVIGDIAEPDLLEMLQDRFNKKVAVVLSDVSPNISGIWDLDHARQIDLAKTSLRIATNMLRLGGSFFVKTFHGDLLKDFENEVKEYFEFVKRIKPRASKTKSSEIYLLALNFGYNVQ